MRFGLEYGVGVVCHVSGKWSSLVKGPLARPELVGAGGSRYYYYETGNVSQGQVYSSWRAERPGAVS